MTRYCYVISFLLLVWLVCACAYASAYKHGWNGSTETSLERSEIAFLARAFAGYIPLKEEHWEKEIKVVRLKVSLISFLIYLFDVSFAASSSFLSFFTSLLILSYSWKIFVIILRLWLFFFFFDNYFYLISVLFVKMIIVIFYCTTIIIIILFFYFFCLLSLRYMKILTYGIHEQYITCLWVCYIMHVSHFLLILIANQSCSCVVFNFFILNISFACVFMYISFDIQWTRHVKLPENFLS